MLLKLVNDISSVKATLQSHHALTYIDVIDFEECSTSSEDEDIIQKYIDLATEINEEFDLDAVGREKVIQTQLFSVKRAELAELQGMSQSLYSEINPLHLPEVLSLVGRRHGQKELYVALKSSIAGVTSTVNRKKYFRERVAYHEAKLAEMRALLAAAESADEDVATNESECCINKKRRRE